MNRNDMQSDVALDKGKFACTDDHWRSWVDTLDSNESTGIPSDRRHGTLAKNHGKSLASLAKILL